MGKVREGYKWTKVGVIPEDWDVVKVNDVFIFIKTYSNSRADLSNQGDIEYLHYGDIHTKYKYHLDLNLNSLPKISSEKIKGNIEYVKDGDIFIADASEDYADIGKSIEAINVNNKKIISGLHTFLLRDKNNNFTSKYKGFIFYNENVSKNIKKIATGISVLGISKTNLGKLLIPLPPLKEQQKIAQILSTWDDAISKQEELIVAKEQFKKGLMQRLLSGEVRFDLGAGTLVPSNKELNTNRTEVPAPEWEEVRLGDVADIIMGQSPSSNSYNEEQIGIPLIQGNADCKNRKTQPRIYTTEKTKECNVGDIIMTVRAPVGAISKSLHNACIGRGVCAIKSKNNNQFLYHFLVNYEEKWEKYSQGSTFTAVNSSDIKALKIKLPPIAEQQKIAQVLTTADKEIELLKKELTALKEQKRGLMQRLLTGVVRTLNIEERK
ncbi:MAG: restriction endonuclease subunit S [Sulfurovum sp.]|nr:restriction endonuclease subunit S [Sulfurovum sp.]